MKRILLSLLTIAAVSAIGVAATRAFFSDVETSEDNTFTAGKIDLQVDFDGYYNQVANGQPNAGHWTLKDLSSEKFFDFGDVKPGDFGEGTISLHVYDNDAWGCVTISPTANDDVSSTEPELTDGDNQEDNQNPWDGELAQNMQFQIWADVCAPTDQYPNARPGDNVYQEDCDGLLTQGTGLTSPVTWALADSQTANVFTGSAGPLVASNTYFIGAGWDIPNSVGNVVQSDKYQADISFYTEQVRNNSGFSCGQRTIPTATPTP